MMLSIIIVFLVCGIVINNQTEATENFVNYCNNTYGVGNWMAEDCNDMFGLIYKCVEVDNNG